MDTLEGSVVAVSFRNSDNDWSVLKIEIPNQPHPVTVTGITAAQVGQGITAQGQWRDKKHNGNVYRNFEAKRITAVNPQSAAGILAYLSSGMIDGIGEKMAKLIVDAFGTETLNVLDSDPDRLAKVKGIGPKRCAALKKAWIEQREVNAIMLFLHTQEISPALCRRIYKQYQNEAMNVVKADPYRLALEVRGVGFKTADSIATQLAVPRSSPQRIRAGILHMMQEVTGNGHTGCEREDFLNRCTQVLNVSNDDVSRELDTLTRDGNGRQLVEIAGTVYQKKLADAEQLIADTLIQRCALDPIWNGRLDVTNAIERAERDAGMRLANKQRQAVHMALTNKISVITGGPGCGKTATLNVLLSIFRNERIMVALAAPTGKAAQRAAEATGVPASTVHRLLGIKGDMTEPSARINADVLVLDEAGMLDVPLMRHVVKCLPNNCSLLLVGDVDQLTSVGPGRVLGDLIDSGAIPVTVLDEIFRQAAGSRIITNAHLINRGQMPEQGAADEDFFLITDSNNEGLRETVELAEQQEQPGLVAEKVAEIISWLVATKLPDRFGLHPINDIQVLAPMNKGACGVKALNVSLQALLNPNPARSISRFGTRFGVGDKVIQVRNNYDLGVFNGDMGLVEDVDAANSQILVRFGESRVALGFDDLDEVRLAYALTVHKSQGSQARAVVIPMVTQHWVLLQRNLFYTGVTRAQELVVVVGQDKAIRAAVRSRSMATRTTHLAQLLRAAKPRGVPPKQPALLSLNDFLSD